MTNLESLSSEIIDLVCHAVELEHEELEVLTDETEQEGSYRDILSIASYSKLESGVSRRLKELVSDALSGDLIVEENITDGKVDSETDKADPH